MEASACCEFKLFQELRGHEEDVRGVARVGGNGQGAKNEFRVASASRDKSVRVWRTGCSANDRGNECECIVVGHEDYVTGVTCQEGARGIDREGKETVILATASRDKTARVWRLGYKTTPQIITSSSSASSSANTTTTDKEKEFVGSECVAVLRGHRYQVTAALVLRNAGEGSKDALTVATASLDGAVRIWRVGKDDVEAEQEKPLQELSDHEGPLLCLCELTDGTLVSGSGDSSIRLWKRTGGSGSFVCAEVKKEHTDTVRSLAQVPDGVGFFSASHDTTVRSWGASGGANKVFVGHNALVYDVKVASTAAGILAVSASEDSTCRVWDNESGQCLQVLEMPGCTWTAEWIPSQVSPLPLLVTGTSDGVVRVFGHDVGSELLDENLIAAFDAAVSERQASASKAQDAAQGFSPQGLKVEEMSALKQPGGKDGQLKTVRDVDGKVYAFQWSVISLQWERVGEVVANPDDAPATGTSSMVAPDKMVDGEHYDYVFDVDVQDGVPPLKLPYNKGENPYEAADRFLLAQNLPASYREQVVQFIIQNTGQSNATAAVPMDVTANVDPYARNQASVAHHVPLNTCLRFEQCKKEAMLGKIREFNSAATPASQLSEKHFQCFDKAVDLGLQHQSLVKGGLDVSTLTEALGLAFSWEKDHVFPIFDILRIVMLAEDSGVLLEEAQEALEGFVTSLSSDEPRAKGIELTVLRMVTNAMGAASPGPLWIEIANRMAESCKSKTKGVRLAWATFLLNCAVLAKDETKVVIDGTLLTSYLLQAASETLDSLDIDSSFRALVGIGTLLHNDPSLKGLARDLGLETLVSKAKQMGGKLSEVSSDIMNQ
ncbi:PFU domain-containing protein [Chloropicon primus]|uniref:WD40 repeat domain-containing protein n=2 Tax=Chloropicon primus TaxID=1764295 RepID=A0A5B8MER5_9CHLO|nr:hypothetical protein A3770_02p14610 [Chloropicon primus]UPQ98151.1 PFU domain-containing protein [Chloropicon primus]|eukprot:QDZ18943.1 hypothetical protein A3770_02p14610 [Chloropicon primus]